MSSQPAKRLRLDVEASDKDQFYTVAKKYWEKIPPTIDGMLGGFGYISNTDIQGSEKFLKPLLVAKRRPMGAHRALDCGSGIGRVSKHLLLRLVKTVDLLDQNQVYLDESYNYLAEDAAGIDRRVCMGLQNFIPDANRYDLVWCQWVLMQLRDDDVVDFFRRCSSGLTKNGLIVLKENITSSGDIEIDETDSSVARSLKLLRSLIRKAGFSIIKEQRQQKFPKELYEVRMFACAIKDPV
uniref:Alpha N-terminal protein methyltransferase 1 n=1 Tax=Strigamia maritima TaxID=126957 RepID=T1IR29_STRMM